MEQEKYETYYVPEQSAWPIIGAIGLFLMALGAGLWLQQRELSVTQNGYMVLLLGVFVIMLMIFGWFRHVIQESMQGLYSKQMDRSFRQGMSWFIFSEVMFFAAFFGALFYIRMFAVPWLSGAGNNAMTHAVLWPEFESMWPLVTTPDGSMTNPMPWQGLPLLNTALLLVSSVTLHFAHVGLEQNKRIQTIVYLIMTLLLGSLFLAFQWQEYMHAYHELDLTLDAGVYGNTFFLLTGFHGMHVTLGSLILFVLLMRILCGHFTPEKHFAFQAGSWYWHFVDVVWLCLFVFVYVL